VNCDRGVDEPRAEIEEDENKDGMHDHAPAGPIRELAEYSELGTTQRYMHLTPAALDSAIRLLDGRCNIVATPANARHHGGKAAKKEAEKFGGEAGIRTLQPRFCK
jgi:hypothetical protein